MAGFVAFELWVPLLAIVVRALAGATVPAAIQALASLLGLAVPTVVALALSDYLTDRPGLVKPYQPKRRSGAGGEGPAGEESAGEGPAGEGQGPRGQTGSDPGESA
jgi:hypothetical protein